MSRELDVRVAEVMGWHWDDDWGCLIPPEQKAKPDEMWTGWHRDNADDDLHRQPVPEAVVSGIVYDGNLSKIVLPEYSTDNDIAAAVMEDWIEADVVLWVRYVQGLRSVVLQNETGEVPDNDESLPGTFVRATPEQRCLAFLAAMEAVGK